MIVYWLFLGYYDRNFVTILIGALGVSIVFDFIFMLLALAHKVGTNRPQSQSGWMVFTAIVLIIEILLRAVLIFKLLSFREPSQKSEYF
jgi:uncharacterized membrane protein